MANTLPPCTRCGGHTVNENYMSNTVSCLVCGHRIYGEIPRRTHRDWMPEVVFYSGREAALQGTTIEAQLRSTPSGGYATMDVSIKCYWCHERTEGRSHSMYRVRGGHMAQLQRQGVISVCRLQCTSGHRLTILTFKDGELRWE